MGKDEQVFSTPIEPGKKHYEANPAWHKDDIKRVRTISNNPLKFKITGIEAHNGMFFSLKPVPPEGYEGYLEITVKVK
jgi:hypothetical protein